MPPLFCQAAPCRRHKYGWLGEPRHAITELRLQAHSTHFLPGGFFESFLRENLNRQYQVLNKLAVGGELTFQAQLRGSLEDLTVGGDLSLKAGEVRSRSNDWEIGPIALQLPFRIHWAEGEKHRASRGARGHSRLRKCASAKQQWGVRAQ